jgi:hypothetical protein
MPHFCGRTHSVRDRRGTLVTDEPRPRIGDSSVPGASKLALTGAVPTSAGVTARGATSLTGATTPAGSATVRAGATPAPTRQQIAALAYSYWEARGRQGGSPEADWLRAERELRGS